MTRGGGEALLRNWAAAAALVIGLAALVAVTARPVVDRGPFELGLLYTLWRYEQALPLIGLGLAFAQTRLPLFVLNCVIFTAGIPAGGVVANWIVAELAAGADIYDQLLLLGPFCCVITGVALVSPAIVRAWLMPAAGLASALVMGMVINLGDSTVEEWSFAAGSIFCGVWLVAAPPLLWRRFERPWFRIASRIFGSWLIAVGVMIGALYLIPQRQTLGQVGSLQSDASAQ